MTFNQFSSRFYCPFSAGNLSSGNLSANTTIGSGVKNAARNALDLRVKVLTELEGIDMAHHITRENALSRKEINVRILYDLHATRIYSVIDVRSSCIIILRKKKVAK